MRSAWDFRLNQSVPVSRLGETIFQLADFGPTCRMRGRTFEFKEPETIRWIDSMSGKDLLIDIGANIGLYSLYAGIKCIPTYAIEPDSLNFALLNLNIYNNGCVDFVRSYCIALHDHLCVAELSKQNLEWGGALSCFEGNTDQNGNMFKALHQQGAVGIPLDMFCNLAKIAPTHIKIDVDGNELLILQGASNTLANSALRSLLIELDEDNPSHLKSLDLLESFGFKLQEKCQSDLVANSGHHTSYNYIFVRE